MPAPAAAAPIAKAAGQMLGRAAAARAARGGQGNGNGGGNGVLLLVVLVLALPVALVIGLVLMVGTVAGGQQQACTPDGGGGGPLPANFTGPGSLGEVGGSGIGRSLVERVRSTSPFAGETITPGSYGTTAYGPPWGGIQGEGVATAGGLSARQPPPAPRPPPHSAGRRA